MKDTSERGRQLDPVSLPEVVSAAELEACSRMAYRIAHSLGNLTAAVVGNAELIARGIHEASILRRTGNIVLAMAEATTLSRHMECFLGHSAHDDQPLDFAAWMGGSDWDEWLKHLPRQVPVEIEPMPLPPLPRPDLSVSRIRHALAALLSNAADAMVDRPGRVRIGVESVCLSEQNLDPLLRCPSMRPGNVLAISVEDEGEGITGGILPHLFSPAFSTRMRQPGFGLSDVYGILCRQHGGGIGLWTTPGTGSRVTLYLPASRSRPATL